MVYIFSTLTRALLISSLLDFINSMQIGPGHTRYLQKLLLLWYWTLYWSNFIKHFGKVKSCVYHSGSCILPNQELHKTAKIPEARTSAHLKLWAQLYFF